MTVSFARRTAALGLLFVVLAPVAYAQRVVERPANGWIGISFDISERRVGQAATVVISDVSEGSPAETVGLRAGDHLLAINELDSPSELRLLAERLHLRAGERVVVEIERNGRRKILRLRAAERPDEFTISRAVDFSFRSDSMVDSWVRAMDSLRLQLAEDRERSVRLAAAPEDTGGSSTVAGKHGHSVRAPFEFFVFRGEDHDSLRREMVELNRTMAALNARLGRREREFNPTVGSDVVLDQDSEFLQLQIALDKAAVRSAGLQTAMAEAARATAGLEYARLGSAGARSGGSADEGPRAEEFRPLTPYLLGRNRVAGAEVVDLRPEFAEYFDVAGGVLVVDVAPGTPASSAGIIPGDVITRIDRVGLRSVEELRFGVSQAGGPLPITLIRQGGSVQVLLRR